MKIVKTGLLLAGLLVISGCTDAYETRGLCSYLGACPDDPCVKDDSCPADAPPATSHDTTDHGSSGADNSSAY